MIIILSIRTEYAEQIFERIKRYEYRRVIPKKSVSKIIAYETAPISMCIGEAEVIRIICDRPDNLWRRTEECAGMSKDKYDAYFEGKNTAYAYILGQTTLYDSPLPITDFGLSRPPQNFAYYAANKAGTSNEPLKQYSVRPVE